MEDDQLPPSSAFAPDLQTLAALAPVARQSVVDAVAQRIACAGRNPHRSLATWDASSIGTRAFIGARGQPSLLARVLGEARSVGPHHYAAWRGHDRRLMARTSRPRDAPGTRWLKGLKLTDPAWRELVRSSLELRRVLASEAVALAAERHTDEDIDAIATCVQVLREHVDDPLAFARADLAFMRAICRAARNVGLELFLNTFARWPDEYPRLVTLLYDNTASSVALYEPVIDIIKSRDGESARLTVRRSLEALDIAWARRHPPPEAAADDVITPLSSNSSKKGKRR